MFAATLTTAVLLATVELAQPKKFRGETYFEQCFESVEDLQLDENPEHFSAAVADYYNAQPAVEVSVTGVNQEYSDSDLAGSLTFIRDLVSAIPPPRTALDCGAGVGRVAARALAPYFDTIDIIEPIEAFAIVAQNRLGARCGNVTIAPVQNVTFPKGKYDLVVVNWLLPHLSDVQAVKMLKRASDSLRPGGYIFVKDNVPPRMWYYLKSPVLGLHRSTRHLQHIFQLAGLGETRPSELHTGVWPQNFFKLRMFALQPGL